MTPHNEYPTINHVELRLFDNVNPDVPYLVLERDISSFSKEEVALFRRYLIKELNQVALYYYDVGRSKQDKVKTELFKDRVVVEAHFTYKVLDHFEQTYLPQIVKLMHVANTLIPYTDMEMCYVKSVDDLHKRISVTLARQQNMYVHVFRHRDLKAYPVVILYTNYLINVNPSQLHVDTLKSYPVEEHFTSVTEYVVDTDTVQVRAKLERLLENLDVLHNPAKVSQGLDETDNEDLQDDLLLKTDLLYTYDKSNDHDNQVVKNSLTHWKHPFFIVMKGNKVWVYISSNVQSYDKRVEQINKLVQQDGDVNSSVSLTSVTVGTIGYDNVGGLGVNLEDVNYDSYPILSIINFGEVI